MIYPMFAMTLLIFVVGLFNVTWRILSVKNKQVRARYYKVYDTGGAEIPAHIIAGSRNYSNQFEVPILFYVVASLVLVLNQTSVAYLALAWLFVISRVVHAFIHMTYNHVLHRMLVFLVGFLAVMAMWVMLLIKLS